MNASKEESRKARRQLENAARLLDCVEDEKFRNEVKRCLLRVDGFLEVAERKLPTEAAYTREKERKRPKLDTGDGPESVKSLFRF